MSHNQPDSSKKNEARRRLLRSLTASGGVMATSALLPREWVSPIVKSVILPAHAQTTGLITGNFGAAASAVTRNDIPSVLDLIVPQAHANGSASVGNVVFTAYWAVGENGADICGDAHFLNASVRLSGNVSRSGNSLGNFSQSVGPAQLEFTAQEVNSGGVSLTASANKQSAQFAAPPGGPGCGVRTASTWGTSSPYADDDEIV